MNRQAVTLKRYGSAATYTGMGCSGEIEKGGAGTVYLFDMLSDEHTNSEKEQGGTLLGLFSEVAWKFSLGRVFGQNRLE